MTRNRLFSMLLSRGLVLLLLLGPLAAVATTQTDYWLKRMMKAVHQTNYDGFFVYLHGNNVESLRTVHTVQDGRELERLFSLNGEAREIVRDDETITRIVPDEKKISTTRRLLNKQSFSGFFVLDLQNIEQNYEVKLQGTGRIADRTTNLLVFTPRDDLRYGYRLHLDDESALPLQWEMFDQQNQLVSSIMFVQISIGNEVTDSGSLLAGGDQQSVNSEQDDAEDPQQVKPSSQWTFSETPRGFSIKHHRNGLPHHKSRNIEQFIFSDGIASFSVYIEKTDKIRLNGLANLGALNAFGVFINGYQVTAVGEVPPDTLTFISSMVPSND